MNFVKRAYYEQQFRGKINTVVNTLIQVRDHGADNYEQAQIAMELIHQHLPLIRQALLFLRNIKADPTEPPKGPGHVA